MAFLLVLFARFTHPKAFAVFITNGVMRLLREVEVAQRRANQIASVYAGSDGYSS